MEKGFIFAARINVLYQLMRLMEDVGLLTVGIVEAHPIGHSPTAQVPVIDDSDSSYGDSDSSHNDDDSEDDDSEEDYSEEESDSDVSFGEANDIMELLD